MRVLIIRESYYVRVYVRGPYFRTNPLVSMMIGKLWSLMVYSLAHVPELMFRNECSYIFLFGPVRVPIRAPKCAS